MTKGLFVIYLLPMKMIYNFEDSFSVCDFTDAVAAFITDKNTVFDVENNKTNKTINFTTTALTGQYTLKIVQPFYNSGRDYGRIYMQHNHNQPVLLARTVCKLHARQSGATNVLNWIFDYLFAGFIKLAKQRQNNEVPLQDNGVKIQNFILNFRNYQH